jgi:fructokinase
MDIKIDSRIRLGVDIGGTKIAAFALDADSGEVKFKTKISTPSSYEMLLKILKDLVGEVENKLNKTVSYGMCYPGSVPPGETLVQNANILWLNQKPFEKDLSAILSRPVKAGNDANCFALSEALDGAGKNKAVVFGATLGTGLGGGVVIHGKILEGLNKLGGEWGHNPMPWPTDEEKNPEACYCSRQGCLEYFLSGTGLARSYATHYARNISAEEIIARAENLEPDALEELALYENRMARAFATVINLIDPDVIVLGGGLSGLNRLYENIPKLWQEYVFSSMPIKTQLLRAVFGPESGMRGAAWLWGR